jgi:hypothetical protein
MADKPTLDTGSVDGKTKVTWKYDVDFNGSPLTLIYTAGLFVGCSSRSSNQMNSERDPRKEDL